MRKRTKLAAGTGAALAVVGAGGAVAATQLSPAEESTAIVADAAKQLGVDPERLGDALRQAFENRIDKAVEDGTLTEEQAKAMKQRLEDGEVPLFAPPLLGRHHRLGPGTHGFHDLEAAAAYLGLSEAELREALRDGKTLADVAEDEGKSVDGLVDALVEATTAKLDAAVADGRLTKERRDEIVARLEERTRAFVERARPLPPDRDGFGFRFRGPGFGPGPHEHEPPPAAA
jgi:Rad3-related DNA helicase